MQANNSIKRSLGISVITQYIELAINFVGVMILARIITSEQIGIYSVAAFLMLLLHVFRDFGVAKYIIQEPDLTRERMRSALGAAMLLAGGVALIMYLLRYPVAKFYGEPQLADIMTVMALSFALTPIGSVVNSIYRRNMELKKVAVVRLSSVLASNLASVFLALDGHGAMSLAWANLANIVTFGFVAALISQGSVPLVPSFRRLREVLHFGSIASLGTLANVGGNNSAEVIIGKMLSLEAAGYFSRGNGMVQMFKNLVASAVQPLILPYFAALRRNSGDIVQPYRMAIAYLTGFTWPFFGVLAVLALPAVRTLYGPNWDASVPLVQILCIAGALSMLNMFAGDVMIANGHIKGFTRLQLSTQPLRVVVLIVAGTFGLFEMAIATAVYEGLLFAISSRALHRTSGISLSAVISATGRSAMVAVFSALGPALVMLFGSSLDAPLVLSLLGGIAAFAGWVGGVFWFRHPIREHLLHASQWLTSRILPGS